MGSATSNVCAGGRRGEAAWIQSAAPSRGCACAMGFDNLFPTGHPPPSDAAPLRPVVFSDLAAIDRALAQSLTDAKSPVVVTSADHISMRQMPPRLEKWLAAVDDSGGRIETQSIDPSEPQRRFLGLIIALIGAIRQAREFVKQEQSAEARNFDAKIFYRRDANGDRVMERVEWVRRQRYAARGQRRQLTPAPHSARSPPPAGAGLHASPTSPRPAPAARPSHHRPTAPRATRSS